MALKDHIDLKAKPLKKLNNNDCFSEEYIPLPLPAVDR